MAKQALQIEIQHGVPVPTTQRARRLTSYPVEDLRKGDSFFVEGKKPGNLAHLKARAKEMKLIFRTVTEEGKTGTRVWRME